jgi:hypothetical protein
MHRFRPRLTFANVTSVLALFVALGGTAYAAATIGPNNIQNDAVRSRHIKDGAVTNAKLAANAVGTGKVIDGSLLKRDFKAGQLPSGPKGNPCLSSDPNCKGPKGDTGAQGPGATQFQVHVNTNNTNLGQGPTVNGITPYVFCHFPDAGKVVIELRLPAGHYLYASGNQALDGTLAAVNFSGQAGDETSPPGPTTGRYYVAASSTADADVIAMSDEVGKYSHFVLGSYNGGNDGCNFWGVITPPSN